MSENFSSSDARKKLRITAVEYEVGGGLRLIVDLENWVVLIGEDRKDAMAILTSPVVAATFSRVQRDVGEAAIVVLDADGELAKKTRHAALASVLIAGVAGNVTGEELERNIRVAKGMPVRVVTNLVVLIDAPERLVEQLAGRLPESLASPFVEQVPGETSVLFANQPSVFSLVRVAGWPGAETVKS